MIMQSNSNVRHIVQIFLDIERPSGIVLTKGFVNYRLDFFLKYTYTSLINQTFRDFEIWLICGRRHRDITSCLKYGESEKLLTPLRVIYPVGTDVIGDTFTFAPAWKKKPTLRIKEFAELDDDYIAITRIDSDDLFRLDAMAEIADQTNIHVNQAPKKRVRLLFRDYIYWDTMNHYLSFQRWESPPFFTHIFPKAIYQDWSRLQSQHFNSHRFLDGGTMAELSSNRVLITYNEQNIARIKRGKSLQVWTGQQRLDFQKKGFKAEFNRAVISKHLKKFGVYDYES